jgi:opacity protein-like surface antigen
LPEDRDDLEQKRIISIQLLAGVGVQMFRGSFSATCNDRRLKSSISAGAGNRSGIAAAAGVVLAGLLFATSAQAQQNCNVSNAGLINPGAAGTSPASIASMIGSAITIANTAFLLQSTVFTTSPDNPAPGQQGAGVWMRGVDGEVGVKTTTNAAASATFPAGTAGTVTCSQKVDQNFAGVQLGDDIAKLNINGWDFHLGATVGYLQSKGNLVGGAFAYSDPFNPAVTDGGGPFTSTTQVPFMGTYAAATFGGFAIDALLRAEYYQSSLNSPGNNLFGQSIDARGVSFSSSASYQWQVPASNWFIEPSAGIIISRVKVDPGNGVTSGAPPALVPPAGDQTSGTLQLNEIKSDIGRLGLRVGTTIETSNVIWRPFAAISVWHEFGPDVTAIGTTCPGCASVGGIPTIITGTTSTSTFGTYGQYSLGVSATLAGTGWLGFARVDYRDGSELQGVSGTGGIRYQFSPETGPKVVMPVKAPVHKTPVAEAVKWTGLYVGGFAGATQGTADWNYAGGGVNPRIGGFIGGGDLGYNYQIDRWVLGAEVALGGTNTNGGTACGPLAVSPLGVPAPMFEMTCKAQAGWLAMATARVGYTWERALFYIKGGTAWTDEKFAATCNFTSVFPCTNPAGAVSTGFTASTNRAGWVIGYGAEFALTGSWSARAEFDYISFGDGDVTTSDGSVIGVGMHLYEATVGVNYRFNGGPIVASY